jgi:hypothetical protein
VRIKIDKVRSPPIQTSGGDQRFSSISFDPDLSQRSGLPKMPENAELLGALRELLGASGDDVSDPGLAGLLPVSGNGACACHV